MLQVYGLYLSVLHQVALESRLIRRNFVDIANRLYAILRNFVYCAQSVFPESIGETFKGDKS